MAVKRRLCCALWIFFACVPNLSYAQNQSANEVLSFLLTTQALPTGDFVKDQQAAAATRDTLARALLVELSAVPLTTSSGGFNYRFNQSLGTLERVTRGFGPFFVDRATTAGAGQASISATFRYSRFETLDGRNLRDGSLVTSSNKFRDEAAPFDVETLALNIETRTFTLFGNYGLTDRIDLGIAIPVVQLSMSGQRVNTYRGATLLQARGQVDAIGLADIPLRSKVRLGQIGAMNVATDVEVRFPTGDPDSLNGSGRYAFTGAVIGSAGEGAIEGHLNAGFTVGGASDQLTLAAAAEATLGDRVTFSGETLIRRVDRLRAIHDVSEPHPSISGVNTLRLLPAGGATTTMSAVAGMRWNVTGTWLVNSYIVVPITDGGLHARPTPAFSIDYSFVP